MTKKKKLRTAGGAILGVSFLVVILYYVFIGYFTGEELDRFTLERGPGSADYFRRSVTWAESETSRHAGPIWLEPAMNPLRVVLDLSRAGARKSSMARLSYDIALVDENGNTLWSASGTHHEKTTGKNGKESLHESQSIAMKAFSIVKPGSYMFYCALKESGMASFMTDVELAVKRNVKMPDKRVLIAGGVTSFIGLIFLIAGYDRKEIFEEAAKQEEHEKNRERQD